MTKQILVQQPPVGLDVPKYRFWGSQKPPEDRADIFAAAQVKVTSTASAEGGDTAGSVATLRMYGPIDSWGGYWGISAKDVSSALDSFGDGVTEIRIRINSPGGEVWEAMAILNMLRAHGARTVAVVDGLAASAASVIAAGCDETVMSPGTQMMIHDASTFGYGDAAEMRKNAEFLDSTSNSIASIYAETAGGTNESWRAVMVEETWYTAEEAVAVQLADRVGVVKDAGDTSTAGDEPEPDVIVVIPDVADLFDLSIFNHAGRDQAPAPKPPVALAPGSTETEGGSAVAFSDEQIATMRSTFSLPEDANEDQILAAAAEAMDKATAPAKNATEIPAGHVVIPAAKLADLEAGAATAAAVAKQLGDEARSKFLDANRTKFAPANRAAWEKEYDRDPEGTRAHFAQAPDIIAISESGHDNPVSEDDAEYFALFPDEKPAEKKGA